MGKSVSELVAGRECGGCTVCCKALKIDVPELKKLADVLCPHCTGTGCGTYDTRPPVCKGWHCGWRRLSQLDDDWRPDRSGILIDVVTDGIPPEFPQVGLKFDIVGSPRVLEWLPLIRLIGSQIVARIPVFLGVPAPIGFERRKIFLNHAMAEAVAEHDRIRMIAGLKLAFATGLNAPQETSTFA